MRILLSLFTIIFTIPAFAQNAELDKIASDRAQLLNQMAKTKCGFNVASCVMKAKNYQIEQENFVKKIENLTDDYTRKYESYLDSFVPQNNSDIKALKNYEKILENNYNKQNEIVKKLNCGLFQDNFKLKTDCKMQGDKLEKLSNTWGKTQELRESTEYAELPIMEKASNLLPKILVVGSVIFGFCVFAILFYLIFLSKRTITPSTNYGSARFLDVEELAKNGFLMNDTEDTRRFYLERIAKKKSNNLQKNPILAIPGEITTRHILVLGGTGSGKSRKVFMPNMIDSANKISVFVTDPSAEIASQTSAFWKSKQFFSPSGNSPNKFNFIPLCKDTITADLLAKSLVEQAGGKSESSRTWNQFATEIVSAIFSHLAASTQPYPHLAYDLVVSPSLLEILKNSESYHAQQVGNSLLKDPQNLFGNKLAGAKSALDFLKHENIRQFCFSDEAINFDSILRGTPTACFWTVPKSDANIYHPLTAIAFQILMKQLTQSKNTKTAVRLMLDEFDDLGKITDFQKRIKDVRKDNISIITGVQNFSQIQSNYGRDDAETIFANLKTKIILTALEGQSAERISKALGKTTVAREHISQTKRHILDFQPNVSRSIQENQRDLLTPDEVRTIDPNIAIVISAEKLPFKAPISYFNNENPVDMSALFAKYKPNRLPKLISEVNQTTVKEIPKIPEMPIMPEIPSLDELQEEESIENPNTVEDTVRESNTNNDNDSWEEFIIIAEEEE